MSSSGFVPDALRAEELRALILEALEHHPGEMLLQTFHARFDHPERGISLDDVIHALESEWGFERPPEFNKEEWQWKYRILAETIDGEHLTLIVAVDTVSKSFRVITRWKR